MPLTIKNYVTELPKNLLALAIKDTVRECDETEKGHYIAYVDEGKDSYDVTLSIGSGGTVMAHTCECKNGTTFCRHKAALLLHVAAGKKVKVLVKAKKKAGPAETLLDDTDPHDLKEWVRELILKNKDIELAFIHRFAAKQQQYTTADVEKLMKDTIKAVGGNKRTIDTTQIKKLVELWTNVLAPVLDGYYGNVAGENEFQNLHTILEQAASFEYSIVSSTNKIAKFVESILQKSIAITDSLQTDEAWFQALAHFIQHIPDGTSKVRMTYLLHVKNLVENSSKERTKKIIALLLEQFGRASPETLYNGSQYTNTIFAIVEAHDLLPEYYNMFKPLYHDNEFNHKLIRVLIDNNQLAVAERYCREQIHSNSREEYDIEYLRLLKEIYTLQQNQDKLVKILIELTPFTFNFDDYLTIIGHLPADEGKKWRSRILSRASNASNNRNYTAVSFCFSLLDYEKEYKKMIGYIDETTPYTTILQYCELMAIADKQGFLRKLLDKADNYGWGTSSDQKGKDELCFPALFDFMVKKYTAEYLLLAVAQEEKNTWRYRTGFFQKYIKERLTALK